MSYGICKHLEIDQDEFTEYHLHAKQHYNFRWRGFSRRENKTVPAFKMPNIPPALKMSCI
jgi:hypothetical protein